MPKEIDKRNLTAIADAQNTDGLEELKAAKLFPLKDISLWTGNPRTINTVPVSLPGSFVEKAKSFLQSQNQSFGFEDIKLPEFMVDAQVAETSTGVKTVHLQQTYHGVPVFLISKAVVFNRDGQVESTVGDNVSLDEEIDIEPKVTALQAANVAAQAILEDDDDDDVHETDGWGEKMAAPSTPQEPFTAKKLVEFSNLPSKPTVLDKSIFAENIRANLVIFYINPEAVLAWNFVITVDESGHQYDVVVAANNPENIEVLYLKSASEHIVARGKVHKTNGGEPKVLTDFPVARSGYPLPVNGTAIAFKEWVGVSDTQGINVVAHPASTMQALKGKLQGQLIEFDAANDKEQQILNIFYFCNFMHDFFFLLGFDEKAGSFDGNDPLIAKAHDFPINGTATMHTPVDGVSPVMNMGLVSGSGRHTALDADVVFHEYVHGVTKRLVGGRLNGNSLKEDQSRSMGEGWSDYFALTIQNFNRTSEKQVTGSWVKNSAAGIRSHPYDDNFNFTYGALPGISSVHRRGELWCATLMHWTRHLTPALPKDRAYFICWQSVVDALKLTNANPSYLEGRDAILRAVQALEESGVISTAEMDITIRQCWASFAKFGMGADAISPGASLAGIVQGTTNPLP